MMKEAFAEKAQELASQAFGNQVNVDEAERLISAVGGGAILLTAANLRSLRGLLATVMGASMIYRGVTGHCPFYSVLGLKTCGQASSRGAGRSASNSRERAGAFAS
jgi:uncharacterized membrane protein